MRVELSRMFSAMQVCVSVWWCGVGFCCVSQLCHRCV